MRITSKGEYAACAVLYLTLKHPEVVTIQEIARRHNIPLKYLEQILLILKNAGILKSRRGIRGGYQLNRSAEQLTVGEVLRVVDANFAQGGLPKTGGEDGAAETCGLHDLWLEVKSAVEAIVDRTTFAELQKRSMAAVAARSRYNYQI